VSATKHAIICQRSWTDEEPDTLTVSVQLDGSTGAACVVFTGSCTWLSSIQAREVREWIVQCIVVADAINLSEDPDS
jgi:hypothetical protein